MSTVMIDFEKNEFEMLALFEMTPDLVCIAGKDGYFKKVNPAVIKKLGYSEEELFSRPIASHVHEDDRELTRSTRDEMLKGKALLNFQNRYISKSGSVIWLQWTSVFLPDKEIVFAIAKDITESKLKEKEIEDKYHAYKSMATQFKNRAEVNRKYLAHELHEEVAQLAVAVKMHIARMAQRATNLPEDNKNIQEALQVSDQLVKTIRRVSFSMSPGMMDDLGFKATLEWECNEFTVLNGIPCYFSSNCNDEDIPKEISIDLYRLSQEIFDNIMEHAEAKEVKLTLNNEAGHISLSITDDGKGFDVGLHNQSAGLQYIHQLAASINAELTIESKIGKGTTVIVRVENNS